MRVKFIHNKYVNDNNIFPFTVPAAQQNLLKQILKIQKAVTQKI